MSSFRFIDLFAGLGGFHKAMTDLGHECVFASESNEELREIYKRNFPEAAKRTFGDLSNVLDQIPEHDVLCAGFPCQPFSKSGFQNGDEDIRGTLFHEIVKVLRQHKPKYLVLENVGNFEQHALGETWRTAKSILEGLGYHVQATQHVKSGGRGLLSPHHFGFPHSRERFFAVGSLNPLGDDILPRPNRKAMPDLKKELQKREEISESERVETALTQRQLDCINHWNLLIKAFPKDDPIPSFPIWADEFKACYSYDGVTPDKLNQQDLLEVTRYLGGNESMASDELLALLPAYATRGHFPDWKKRFIKQNRQWFEEYSKYFPQDWLETLSGFPASLRKMEWNCHGEERDLWKHVLQFRPSGLRAKRMTSVPALVSLTTTQIPIIGPQQRFITRVEGLRLQGFLDSHELPKTRSEAFQALGNAVHVGLAKLIIGRLLDFESRSSVAYLPGCEDETLGTVIDLQTTEVDRASAIGS